MAEKSQNADSGKEIKEKKKRQHNNRKVFRLCRQTLIILLIQILCINVQIFMPLDRMIRGILFLSCLFVCLFVWHCQLYHSLLLWSVRNRGFIFGMHTQIMTPFQMTPRSITQWPCDLDFDLRAKNSFFRLCCHRGHSVSQTHLDFWYLH